MNGELVTWVTLMTWAGTNLVRKVWKGLDGQAVWGLVAILAFLFSLLAHYLFGAQVLETFLSAFVLATGGDTALKRFLPTDKTKEPAVVEKAKEVVETLISGEAKDLSAQGEELLNKVSEVIKAELEEAAKRKEEAKAFEDEVKKRMEELLRNRTRFF